jgi:predicted DNA-binding transcriptional regulator YafY
MLYQRSLNIEHRLQNLLSLIETGRYSTPDLAQKLGVSIPTISRDVMALRQRGHDIRAERAGSEWHYILAAANSNKRRGKSLQLMKRKPR